MDTRWKMTNCRKNPYQPQFLYSTDRNFYERKMSLENSGYSVQKVKTINIYCEEYIMAKPNAILADFVDEAGNVYRDINIYGAISKYFRLQRIYDNRIKEFEDGVNSGKIKVAIDRYSNAYVIR